MALKQLIASRKAPVSRSMGPHVRQVIPSTFHDFDPFVFLDHFGPIALKEDGLNVPPHPHAGIATITYLLEGSNRHQDSLGNDAMIYKGDIGWMQAGKGIVHAEGMNENRTAPEDIHGLQFWISLPAKDKFAEPFFKAYPSDQLPVIQYENATVKLLCGALNGQVSPVKSLSPAYIFEVHLKAGASLDMDILPGDTCGVYIVQGQLTDGDTNMTNMTMAKYDDIGNSLHLSAAVDTHCMVMGGTPLKEPIVAYASFVMNSEDQIRKVIMDYQLGKMGTVAM